jgi:hypothetical protein
VQLTVYFVQETALSLLYIWHARKLLRNSSLFSRTHVYPVSTLGLPSTTTTTTTRTRFAPETRQVLRHLVLANIIVIVLDAALLGVQCANLFYLQGAFKPCVYGVKLKVEFAILNRLIGVIRRRKARPPNTSSRSGGDTGTSMGVCQPTTVGRAREKPLPPIPPQKFCEPTPLSEHGCRRPEEVGLGRGLPGSSAGEGTFSCPRDVGGQGCDEGGWRWTYGAAEPGASMRGLQLLW